MNKYVVAFLSFHNNEILMEVIKATSKLEAAISYLTEFTEWSDLDEHKNISSLQEYLFDGDCLIEVLDLSKALKTNWGGGGLQTRIAQFDSESRFQ
jgi:hypothetical protein